MIQNVRVRLEKLQLYNFDSKTNCIMIALFLFFMQFVLLFLNAAVVCSVVP